MTASLEANILQYVSYILYPIQSQRDQAEEVKALIDSNSEINIITPVFAVRLGLSIHLTDIVAQKIDSPL